MHSNQSNNTLIRNRKFLKPKYDINNEFQDHYFNKLLDSKFDYYEPKDILPNIDKHEKQNRNNLARQEPRDEPIIVNNSEGIATQQFTTKKGRMMKRPAYLQDYET